MRIYSEDIKVKFGIEICAMLMRRSGKHQMKEGIELSNQQKKKNQNARRGSLQVPENIGSAHHQTSVEEKNIKRVSQKNEKLRETRLYSRNLIKSKNTRAVPLVKHSGQFLKWMTEELHKMYQRIRKTNDDA